MSGNKELEIEPELLPERSPNGDHHHHHHPAERSAQQRQQQSSSSPPDLKQLLDRTYEVLTDVKGASRFTTIFRSEGSPAAEIHLTTMAHMILPETHQACQLPDDIILDLVTAKKRAHPYGMTKMNMPPPPPPSSSSSYSSGGVAAAPPPSPMDDIIVSRDR